MLRRWIGRCLAMTGLALVGVIAAPGCADVDSELFIRQVVFRTAPECTATPTSDSLAVGTGYLDTSLRSEYVATLLVGNQLVSRGSVDLLRTETNRVSLTSADVVVENAAGGELSSFSVPITGFVDQSQGTEPGFGLAIVTLLDSKAASAAGAKDASPKRVVTKVRLFGKTLGGKDVQTNEFQFIVFVCKGCLINHPPGTDDPTVDGVDCTLPGASDIDQNSVPCITGQDTSVDCRICHAAGKC